MDAKLEKLVAGLIRIADIRNLDFDNPVKVTLQTGELFPVITLVSMQEPSRGKYPADVVWVDADPTSDTYKRIFKRRAKQPDPSTPRWMHSWTQLFAYVDVFTPNQHYDEGDDENVVAIQEVVDHIHNLYNPHQTTSQQVGALPISGGTMIGDLILNRDPIQDSPPLIAVTKYYVDTHFDLLRDATLNLNVVTQNLDSKITNIENVKIPSVETQVTELAWEDNNQRLKNASYDTLLASLVSLTEQHSTDIALLNNSVGIGKSYLEVSVFDNFKNTQFTPLANSVSTLQSNFTALKNDYDAFKQMALNIFNTSHTRVKTFEYVQSSAAEEWIISHNLDTTSYLVGLLDAANEIQYAGTVQALDSNRIKVTYNAPVVGKAVVIALT